MEEEKGGGGGHLGEIETIKPLFSLSVHSGNRILGMPICLLETVLP